MLANLRLAPLLCCHVHNLGAMAGKNLVEVFRRAMKLLRAEHEVHVGKFINQLLAPALRHAAHEAEHHVGTVLPHVGSNVLHLAHGLALGHVAHGTGVEQDDIRDVLGGRESVALRHELRGDGLAVTLVHLATVGFDIDAGHRL